MPLFPLLAQLPPMFLGSVFPLPLPSGFPLSFCGYVLDTPDTCLVPARSLALVQGSVVSFFFRSPSQAILGLLSSGAIGMLTFPLTDTTLFSCPVSVQSVSTGSLFYVSCTLLTTTSLQKGTVFS